MQIETIEFFKHGKQIASCVGKFNSLPGRGEVVWENKDALEQMLRPIAPENFKLDDYHYAEWFSAAMANIAGRIGLTITHAVSGDYDLVQGDDLVFEGGKT